MSSKKKSPAFAKASTSIKISVDRSAGKKVQSPKSKKSAGGKWRLVKRTKNQKNKSPLARKAANKTALNQAPITFGFLQHEVDQFFTKNERGQSEKKLEASIVRELADALPKNEIVTPAKIAGHTDIIIQNTNSGANHSPFVLDLTSLIEKKRQREEKKHLIRNFFKKETVEQKEPEQIEEEEIVEAETPVILAEFEGKLALPKVTQENTRTFKEQFTPTPLFYHFGLPINWHRSLIAYLAVCLLVVIPIKGFGYFSNLKETQTQMVNYANTAYQDLKIASRAIAENNTDNASENFTKANDTFAEAADKISNINVVVKNIINLVPREGANLADAEYLLRAGKGISSVGQDLVGLLSNFGQAATTKLTDRITLLQTDIQNILPKLDEINNNLNKVRIEAIPTEQQATFKTAKKYFSMILSDVKDLQSLSSAFNEILGKEYKKRYLFVFQNNNEIRPTGGFMGSLALVDIDRGEIKNIEIPGGGTYDLQGGLLENLISPYPLQLINAKFELQDTNWFPDFPASAEKIKWTYEKAGGPSVDGVIAINVSLIPQLLQITGPINLITYGQTLTADNFTNELQKTIEIDNRGNRTPKQILSDFAPLFIEKLFSVSGENLVKIISTLKSGLNEKDVQLYFHDPSLQAKVASYNWTGEMKNTSKDFLSVVNANIGGGKTDNFINQKVDLASSINDSGDITNTLTITREHTGAINDLFGSKSNVDYVRIYVPEGSKLLSASGFSTIPAEKFEKPAKNAEVDDYLNEIQGKIWVEKESGTQINNEFGKTVFGNWLQTDHGETSAATIRYKLPFVVNFPKEKSWFSLFAKKEASTFHSLYLEKQSGAQNTEFNVSLIMPNSEKLSWSYPELIKKTKTGFEFTTPLAEDQLIAFVFE